MNCYGIIHNFAVSVGPGGSDYTDSHWRSGNRCCAALWRRYRIWAYYLANRQNLQKEEVSPVTGTPSFCLDQDRKIRAKNRPYYEKKR